MNPLSIKAINKLEYKQVMKQLSEYAVSVTAKKSILNAVPSTDFFEATN